MDQVASSEEWAVRSSRRELLRGKKGGSQPPETSNAGWMKPRRGLLLPLSWWRWTEKGGQDLRRRQRSGVWIDRQEAVADQQPGAFQDSDAEAAGASA